MLARKYALVSALTQNAMHSDGGIGSDEPCVRVFDDIIFALMDANTLIEKHRPDVYDRAHGKEYPDPLAEFQDVLEPTEAFHILPIVG